MPRPPVVYPLHPFWVPGTARLQEGRIENERKSNVIWR